MTTPGGDQGGEDERETVTGPVAARSSLAAAASPSPTWVAILAWAVALLVILALSGLAAVAVRTYGTARPLITLQIGGAREPAYVAPLPGAPPAMPETAEDKAEGEGQAVVVAPTWQVRPGGVFPNKAQRLAVEYGEVELQCPVDAEGRIQSCWILRETPAGVGFGQAALAGAVEARLSPRTVDGVARGGMVRFTTRFALQ